MREIGSEFDFDSNNGFIDTNVKTSFFTDAEFYRSGRDALKAIAINYKGLCKRILIPALCCESMVEPFKFNEYKVVYYKLNTNLTANLEDVLSKLQPMDLFLYMNYFGIQSFSDEMLGFIKRNFKNIIMIEDITHDILFSRHDSFMPNFRVCSIRKWLAIPDGGVLYSKSDKLNIKMGNNTYFSDIRGEALKNKSMYLQSGESKLKDIYRQQLAYANTYLDKDKEVVGMSQESFEILKSIDFEKIIDVRRRNIDILDQALITFENVKQIKEVNSKRIILYYPVILKDRDRIQDELAKKMIFCPVIWPLPKEAKGICENSDYISTNMLALPYDHRYGNTEMKYILKTLKELLRSSN